MSHDSRTLNPQRRGNGPYMYQKKIAKRQNLLESFSGLQDHLGSDFAHIELNSIVLYNVVVSYFDDVTP